MCHFLAPAGQPEMMHENFTHWHLRMFVVQLLMHEVLYNEAAVGGEDLPGEEGGAVTWRRRPRRRRCPPGCPQRAQRGLAGTSSSQGLVRQATWTISVSMTPGATQLTRMPEGASSMARERVRADEGGLGSRSRPPRRWPPAGPRWRRCLRCSPVFPRSCGGGPP